MKSSFSLFPILFSFLSSTSFAWTVMVVRGSEATFQSKDGATKPLKVGQVLAEGDRVKSGKESKVKLVENKSVVVVAENSNLILKAADKSTEENLTTLFLEKGNLRVQVDKPEAAKFKFRIPSIVAGVRGTEFFMSASIEKEILCVLEGSVNAYEIATKGRAVVEKNIGWIREGNQPGKLLPTSDEQRAGWISKTNVD